MLSMRPGNFWSHSRSIFLTCTLQVLWLPHSVHGMIGNWRCAAQRSMSVSAT